MSKADYKLVSFSNASDKYEQLHVYIGENRIWEASNAKFLMVIISSILIGISLTHAPNTTGTFFILTRLIKFRLTKYKSTN